MATSNQSQQIFEKFILQADNFTYEGQVIQHGPKDQYLPHGRGRVSFKNGGYFEGVFVYGMKEGLGKKVNPDGSYYEGNYFDDVPHGQGKYQWANGDFYDGQWNQGFFHGKGKKSQVDGSYYQGNWLKGRPHGDGECYNSQQRVTFIGEWQDGLFHGRGTQILNQAGQIFKGLFKKGMKDGDGVKVFSNGNRLEGSWKDNKFQKGKYIQMGGPTYDGDWLGGRAHGQGRKEWGDGKKYQGMFRFGKPWGAGIKSYGDGKERIGFWDGDKFLDQMPSEQQFQTFNEILKNDFDTFEFKQMAVSLMQKKKTMGIDDDFRLDNFNIGQYDDEILKMEESLAKATYFIKKQPIQENPIVQQLRDIKKDEPRATQKDMSEVIKQAKEIQKEIQDANNKVDEIALRQKQLDEERIKKEAEELKMQLEKAQADEQDRELERRRQEMERMLKQSIIKSEQDVSDNQSPKAVIEKQKFIIEPSKIEIEKEQAKKKLSSTENNNPGQRVATQDSMQFTDTESVKADKFNGQRGKRALLKKDKSPEKINQNKDKTVLIAVQTTPQITKPKPSLVNEEKKLENEEKLSKIDKLLNLKTGLDDMNISVNEEMMQQRKTKKKRKAKSSLAKVQLSAQAKVFKSPRVNQTSSIESPKSPQIPSSLKKKQLEKKKAEDTDQEREFILQEKEKPQDKLAVYKIKVQQINKKIVEQKEREKKKQSIDQANYEEGGPLTHPSQMIRNRSSEITRNQDEQKQRQKEFNTIAENAYKRLANVQLNQQISLYKKNRREVQEYKSLFLFKSQDFIKMEEGVYYMGEMRGGKPHGSGTMLNFNQYDELSAVYKGNFYNGLSEGQGTLIFDGGLGRYEGQWRRGRYDGLALYFQYFLENHTMSKYEGSFVNGVMQGNGIFTWPNGSQYSGYWIDGKRQGFGKYTGDEGKLVQEGWWQSDIYLGQSEQEYIDNQVGPRIGGKKNYQQ